ncbi:MAG: Na/Pi cotransporter family protein, partial [Leptospiraceae bacterium]|nr:Na/Pi cotransporter family protein [Leptospiraceae bacterium]
MKTWNVWEFLAGLGIFLLGMSLLQDAIKALSGKSLKRLIRMYTKTRIRSILSGFVSTSILQSSSASSLMLVAFVGAGLMDLSNAIGVILGSNIGSTMTSWIVATMGFKVKLESFAMPLVGLGGISYVLLGKKEFWKYLSLLFVGFGFLFMGIGYMKSSVDVLASKFDVNSFKSYGLFSFLLFGTVLTALIQASSAAIAIVLTALNSGIITFEMAIAIVIGTNIGTTATVLLGTIGGTSNQKKVAFSHFFFNIITAFISVLLLPVYSYLIQDFLHLGQDPVIALATFHSLFNVFGVLLFFPFVKQFALFIEKISPKDNNQYANFHSLIDTDIPEAAIHEFKKEVKAFLDLCIYHNLKIMSLEPELIISDKSLQEI